MRRFFALLCLGMAGCGGGGGSNTPTTPNPPAPTPNRAPIINNVTVNPGSGLQDRTVFNFAVSATDPDGDGLAYTWSINGSPFTGQNVAFIFLTGGTGTATVTVSDGKGGTANGSQTFLVSTMTGNWSGTGPFGTFTMNLTQANTFITGTYRDQIGPAVVGPTGEPGTIDGNGNVSLRVKQAPFTDWTFKGTLDATGRRVTGGVFGSGFNGQPFTMTK